MLYRSFKACDVLRRESPRLTCSVRHKDMTWALCLLNLREEAFLGRVFKSMLKKIHRELTVDVMEFVFILAIVFFQICLIYLF